MIVFIWSVLNPPSCCSATIFTSLVVMFLGNWSGPLSYNRSVLISDSAGGIISVRSSRIETKRRRNATYQHPAPPLPVRLCGGCAMAMYMANARLKVPLKLTQRGDEFSAFAALEATCYMFRHLDKQQPRSPERTNKRNECEEGAYICILLAGTIEKGIKKYKGLKK